MLKRGFISFFQDLPKLGSYRLTLLEAVAKLYNTDNTYVGVFTCGGYIFTIACMSGHYLIMDTHKIGKELGGLDGGILAVFPCGENSSQVCDEKKA